MKLLWVYLDNTGSDLKFDQYCDKMERFMNQDELGIKRFWFEIYDTMNNDRITEESLFKFMSVMTRKVPGVSSQPEHLLALSGHESDMFLDLFASDFCKIQ